MKNGANIAAPEDPAVWQTAAEMYKVRGESFICATIATRLSRTYQRQSMTVDSEKQA